MSKKYYATQTVVVASPGPRVQLLADQPVPEKDIAELRPGTLKSLLQTRKLVLEEDYLSRSQVVDSKPSTPSVPDVPKWMSTPVSDLDIPQQLKDLLAKNSLATVQDVLNVGSANDDGLCSIEGIAEPSEKKIQAAIQKIAK